MFNFSKIWPDQKEISKESEKPCDHLFLYIAFSTLNKTLLTLSFLFLFFWFIYSFVLYYLIIKTFIIHSTLRQICACMLRKLIDHRHILSYSVWVLLEYMLACCELWANKVRVASLWHCELRENKFGSCKPKNQLVANLQNNDLRGYKSI